MSSSEDIDVIFMPMKILVLCAHGKNRSRYLAEYLSQKGYDAEAAGVDQVDKEDVVRKINAADVVVSVNRSVRERLFKNFDLTGKRHIELEVEDRPEYVLSKHKILSGEDWIAFQEEYVYPELKRQMDKYLPLASSS
jgi:predicted protein tyrosine phosphatase